MAKKIFFLTIFILCNNLLCLGQSKNIVIEGAKTNDSSFLKQSDLEKRINLVFWNPSFHKWYYQINLNGQSLEVWQTQKEEKQSVLTSWAKEAVPTIREKDTERYAFKKDTLSLSVTLQIIEKINFFNIKNLVCQHTDEYWEGGIIDHGNCNISYTDNAMYAIQSCCYPKNSASLRQFIKDVFILIDAEGKNRVFRQQICFECYQIGTTYSKTCKFLSKKQSKVYRREREQYRRFHKITSHK